MGAPPIIYPQEAIDEGVNEFEVLVQILIDQEGRTVPIRIVRNPYPSFEGDLHDFVSNVVFSPPTRLGVPVRAEYLWPIGIRQSMSRP
jgi:outer membrane biosynthesis protein TonB